VSVTNDTYFDSLNMMVNSVVRFVSQSSIRSGVRGECVRSQDSDTRTGLFTESELSILVLGTSSKSCSRELIN
jgi:hypothetical protein